MKNLLLEKKLASDFNIELSLNVKNTWMYSGNEIKKIVKDIYPKSYVSIDGSDLDIETVKLPVNAGSLQILINLFKKCIEEEIFYITDMSDIRYDVFTNGLTAEDYCWLISHMSLDDNIQNIINESFKTKLPNTVNVEDIKQSVLDGNFHSLAKLCSEYKGILCASGSASFILYGNPSFFKKGDAEQIIEFHKTLFHVVQWIRDTLDKTEINSINKETFYHNIKETIDDLPKKRINGFNPSKEDKGQLTHDELSKLDTKMYRFGTPKILSTFINKPQQLKQLIGYVIENHGYRYTTNNISVEYSNKNKLSETDKKLLVMLIDMIPSAVFSVKPELLPADMLYNIKPNTLKLLFDSLKQGISFKNLTTSLMNVIDMMNPKIFSKENAPYLYDNSLNWCSSEDALKFLNYLKKYGYLKQFDDTEEFINLLNTDSYETGINLGFATVNEILKIFQGDAKATLAILNRFQFAIIDLPDAFLKNKDFQVSNDLIAFVYNKTKNDMEELNFLLTKMVNSGKVTKERLKTVIDKVEGFRKSFNRIHYINAQPIKYDDEPLEFKEN
jgi:hypothetical protein